MSYFCHLAMCLQCFIIRKGIPNILELRVTLWPPISLCTEHYFFINLLTSPLLCYSHRFILLHHLGMLGAQRQAPVTQFQRAHFLGAMKWVPNCDTWPYVEAGALVSNLLSECREKHTARRWKSLTTAFGIAVKEYETITISLGCRKCCKYISQ